MARRRQSGTRLLGARRRRGARWRLVYRGGWPIAALAAVLTTAGVTVEVAAHRNGLVVLPIAVLVVWLGYALRVRRPVPAGGGRGGPDPEPGAGVREPRRPLPMSPAGAAERPLG